jgi:hypothetical protein
MDMIMIAPIMKAVVKSRNVGLPTCSFMTWRAVGGVTPLDAWSNFVEFVSPVDTQVSATAYFFRKYESKVA